MKNSDVILSDDLIGERVTTNDCLKVEAILKANKSDIEQPILSQLWLMIKNDGWTTTRLENVIAYILKNHPYKRLTIADFYQAELAKMYSYAKVQHLVAEGAKWDEFEAYDIRGAVLWSEKVNDLPFPIKESKKPEILTGKQVKKINKNWKEFFENDKNWNEAKNKVIETGNVELTRSQLLKELGNEAYSEEVYQKYIKSRKQ